MELKVTPQCLDLATALIEAGYTGCISIERVGYSGAQEVIGHTPVIMKLTGFCKECYHLAEDTGTGETVIVGRYALVHRGEMPTVENMVAGAWSCYKRYKNKGYEVPHEWRNLFIKFGFLKEKTVTVFEEAD